MCWPSSHPPWPHGAPHTCFACTRPDPTEPYAADGDGNDEDRPGPPRRAAPSSFGSSRGPEWPQPRDSRASGGHRLAKSPNRDDVTEEPNLSLNLVNSSPPEGSLNPTSYPAQPTMTMPTGFVGSRVVLPDGQTDTVALRMPDNLGWKVDIDDGPKQAFKDDDLCPCTAEPGSPLPAAVSGPGALIWMRCANMDEVNHLLASSDPIEIKMRALASQEYLARTGDRCGAHQMLAVKPTGVSVDLAPGWLVSGVTQFPKAEHQRREGVESANRGRGRGCGPRQTGAPAPQQEQQGEAGERARGGRRGGRRGAK